MQREREKKERAAAKRERRQERASATPDETMVPSAGPAGDELSASDLMRLVEAIHSEYEAGTIDLDTFEEKKSELLARVRID
jgi:hypothetical protein